MGDRRQRLTESQGMPSAFILVPMQCDIIVWVHLRARSFNDRFMRLLTPEAT